MSHRITHVVAVSENAVIGRDGDMPWKLSTDLKRFKALTMGKPVVMGRKTWDSIGRPLPGRSNIVISRRSDFLPEGATLVSSLEAALDTARAFGPEICIIGGGEIYRQSMDLTDVIHLTRVESVIEGDTRYPEIDQDMFVLTDHERPEQGEKDSHAMRFETWTRKTARQINES